MVLAGTCVVLQNLIFRFLQSRQKVQIWLFEQKDLRIEGRIIVSMGMPMLQSQTSQSSAEFQNRLYWLATSYV